MHLRIGKSGVISAVVLVTACAPVFASDAVDPLASWNEGTTKSSITHFVEEVTKQNGANFVPQAERIATFDNDGTLWLEQPLPVQLVFILDRVKTLAPDHPEWKEQEPFKSVLAGDLKNLDGKSLMQLIAATSAGMTTQEYAAIVKQWLDTTKDSRFKRTYTHLVYQPMLELLAYLRENGFKTYIVSGGGIEFMRTFAERVYGIPPEQVIGTTGKLKFEFREGKPVLLKLPQVDFIDNNDGKPIDIEKFIGRRPIAAFGNSDGDLEMLQWTTGGAGLRFALYVHHTDAEREYAYDKDFQFSPLVRGLEEAKARGWTVVDMKKDWKTIFPKD